MRPNAIGWFIVAFFFIGGIVFWIVTPEIFIGQIWVVVAALMALFFWRMQRRSDEADELIRTGIPGSAQILHMTQTGMYVNEQPRVKLKLHIEAPGVAPFEHEKTWTVPLIALGRLSTGMPLAVYLAPNDPTEYVIDWFGAPGTGGGEARVGNVTVNPAGGGTLDLSANPQAQQAIMHALSEHGVDVTTGSVDLRQAGAARDAVLKALQEHGIDVAHDVAAADPTTPIVMPDKGAPVERMMKLRQLKDANLITQKEFDQYRKKILGEL